MYSINGIGTTLYGRRYLSKKELRSIGVEVPEGMHPYIATKWFVFLFIPLIPLGSYVVFYDYDAENKDFLTYDKKYFHMIKINLNWNQVLKTWIIPIIVLFLLWLFFR
jgi:hypothetical protein